ncbi:hypothetical protein BTO20_09000 [Mycobacterium dioxanotrophicus]|uniref:Secretion protein EspD n=1 Tax=Mycobacterium dioxanotrophicus TaxID=482462 RepID=A0A1Y0C0M9_9MYCO|nr:hypothetical protein [Mycobacterium dioxanotrophicus]ART68702.1 hypothetical protein BTO20_09000 [Mycobacterium dioxanotrophicus]
MTDDWSHSTDSWDEWIDVAADDREAAAGDSDETVETLLVTAVSPSGAVTANGLVDGTVIQVALSTQVTRMTEAELADEVVTTCALASRQAEAAQHYLLATLMRALGQDPASTRSFLEHTIGLPTPETVISEKARMLADYYSGTE